MSNSQKQKCLQIQAGLHLVFVEHFSEHHFVLDEGCGDVTKLEGGRFGHGAVFYPAPLAELPQLVVSLDSMGDQVTALLREQHGTAEQGPGEGEALVEESVEIVGLFGQEIGG